jgi:DUF1680 family protein
MNMLSGNAKYIDVLERSLYNGALDGVSLSGDRFFYGNPLSSRGDKSRREWFGTACCPSNIARLVSSLGNYIYGTSSNSIWVNLFVGSNTRVSLGKNKVNLSLETGYPWNGNVQLTVSPTSKQKFDVNIRIPGWLNEPVPGDLYHYSSKNISKPTILVNGEKADYSEVNGYAVINRTWKKGDVIKVAFPMEVKKVISNPGIKQNDSRLALQYGPLMYCVEGIDNPGINSGLVVPENTVFQTVFEPGLLEGVNTIRFEAPVVTIANNSESITTEKRKIKAIPYYSWNNRGSYDMQVWLPSVIKNFSINAK